MNFNELQVIWNAQQEQPLFAFDRESLHRLVEEKASRIEAYVTWFEITMIAVPLLMAIILPLDAWREGGGWDQYVVGAICLLVGIVVFVGKLVRPKTNASFESTIKGTIEQSLDQIDRYLRQLKWMFWGFHLPIAISAAIGLTVYSNVRTPLVWGAVMAITTISYWGTRQDAQKRRQEQQELKQLQAKLTEGESEAVSSLPK